MKHPTFCIDQRFADGTIDLGAYGGHEAELAQVEAFANGLTWMPPPPTAANGVAVGAMHNSIPAGIPPIGRASPTAMAAAAPTLTVFEQFEAIVDSLAFTAEQKCMLVKARCRVNAKTMDNAIVSNEGFMRAASLKCPRALRSELRDLQGKARDLPEERDKWGRPIKDPIDESRATIVVEERSGKANVVGFTPERLNAIFAAYLQHREQKRGPGKPPASGAPPFIDKPPASHSGGLEGKLPAAGSGGLGKPPASGTGGLAENPLSDAPRSFKERKKEEGADAPTHLNGAAGNAAEVDAAHAAYNEAARMHGFEQCRVLTVSRRKRLAARLADIGGLAAFGRALSAIPQHDFLMGRVAPKPGQARFKLDINRLMQTEGGLGDVLAKLLDLADSSTTPSQCSLEDEVRKLAGTDTGKKLIGRFGDAEGLQRLREIVIENRRRRGL